MRTLLQECQKELPDILRTYALGWETEGLLPDIATHKCVVAEEALNIGAADAKPLSLFVGDGLGICRVAANLSEIRAGLKREALRRISGSRKKRVCCQKS
ncbi:MAG: hypothetical protein WEB61_15510 [Parvibaculum sp.]